MVRLNKNILSTTQRQQLLSQFKQSLNTHGASIISELLGEEEQLMVAKRLSAIVLLCEGFSMYKISQVLKLSPTTVEKIAARLEQGEYEQTLAIFSKSKKSYFSILETLDSVLHLGGVLPHYNGLERYSNRK